MSGTTLGRDILNAARAELESYCVEIGRTIIPHLPKGCGFALLLFTYGEGDSAYVSNCNREDMIKALREQADRLEGAPRKGAGS